jgi:glutaredoxin
MTNASSSDRFRSRVGSLAFALGVCGLSLCWLSRTGLLAAGLTRMITRSEVILILISLVAVGAGCGLLWSGTHPRTRWRPRQSGPRFHSLVFYTRANCGLCVEARELLARYRAWLPPVVDVDIDEDPVLRAQFDACVPVVELDGQVRFRGHVNELLLQRLIDATPPLSTAARQLRGT